tara:strand:+ start:2704 stop:3357 length:654 start_codon:yes stop_codon:yes gene_type:complete
MVDKKFTYFENILSTQLADELHDYYYKKVIELSRPVYGDQLVEHFLNGKARQVLPSTVNLTQDQQLRILEELYNNEQLPFYKDKRILRGLGLPMRINNFLPGGGFPPHTDNAWGSMTLFLNKEWKEEWGGNFVWYTDEDTNQENGIAHTPKYNCGILDCYPEPTVGCLHRVEEVTTERLSVQAFWGLGGDYINIGNIPEKYMYMIPEELRHQFIKKA